MTVEERQMIEREIVEKVIDQLHAAGVWFNIDNGGEGLELPRPTQDRELLLLMMFATDDEKLLVYNDGGYLGWIEFVYGNGGWDVVHDYTTNLEPLMTEAGKLADHYSNLE